MLLVDEGARSATAVTTVATLPKYSLLDETTSRRSARVAYSAILVQAEQQRNKPQAQVTTLPLLYIKMACVCSKINCNRAKNRVGRATWKKNLILDGLYRKKLDNGRLCN